MANFKGVDYMLIDSSFNEQELLVRQTARQFVEDRVIPVIFVTAYTDEQQVLEGYKAGAVDYITRPYSPVILRAKVRVFLELDRQKYIIKRLNRLNDAIIQGYFKAGVSKPLWVISAIDPNVIELAEFA